jgi:hypothetical protein
MSTVAERLIGWLLRSAAGAVLSAGAAIFVACVPVFSLMSDSAVPRAIAGILMQVGGAFVVAGAISSYLSRSRRWLLPNERVITAANQRPAVGGWLMVLSVTLVAAPVWLLLKTQPFLAEWRRVIELASAPGLWDNANANMSGVVLMPIAAALTPPFFELATLIGFVVSSLTLLPLLLSRSPRFPRLYVMCVILLSALVFASMRGASAAALASDALRQLIDTTSANAQEAASIRQAFERYSVVFTTAPSLLWTLFAYVVWVPAILSSTRVHSTFAEREAPVVSTPAKAADVAAITSPPRFPGF